MPTPSARICSSSGVAPPVMRVRINVSALSLKYVCKQTRPPTDHDNCLHAAETTTNNYYAYYYYHYYVA